MYGKIIKGIAGFYYVYVVGSGVYECKAKGAFRSMGLKPLVGDNVSFAVVDEQDKTGNIEEILPRSSELIRPAVANVDQALVIFAAAKPKPNFNLLDRFLIVMQRQGVPAVICFNKQDLAETRELEPLRATYEGCGYEVRFASALEHSGVSEIRELLKGKTTAVAGPSGVGKSSLINILSPDAQMETGGISRKTQRGRHTTRHTELFPLDDESFILDTPGFSSIYIPDMEKEELREYFPEFGRYEDRCRFQGCAHLDEPDCAVKAALDRGEISPVRYDNYRHIYEELKDRRRY